MSVHRYGSYSAAAEDESEPDEEDLVTGDHRRFYQGDKLAFTVDPDASKRQMWRAIDAHMERERFWPNVWFISDHGNAHVMDRPRGRR